MSITPPDTLINLTSKWHITHVQTKPGGHNSNMQTHSHFPEPATIRRGRAQNHQSPRGDEQTRQYLQQRLLWIKSCWRRKGADNSASVTEITRRSYKQPQREKNHSFLRYWLQSQAGGRRDKRLGGQRSQCGAGQPTTGQLSWAGVPQTTWQDGARQTRLGDPHVGDTAHPAAAWRRTQTLPLPGHDTGRPGHPRVSLLSAWGALKSSFSWIYYQVFLCVCAFRSEVKERVVWVDTKKTQVKNKAGKLKEKETTILEVRSFLSLDLPGYKQKQVRGTDIKW